MLPIALPDYAGPAAALSDKAGWPAAMHATGFWRAMPMRLVR